MVHVAPRVLAPVATQTRTGCVLALAPGPRSVLILLQRVSSASVEVEGDVVGRIGPGLLALVGIHRGDGPGEAVRLARKTASCRLFQVGGRDWEASVEEVGGEVLVVSQFTLCADASRGRRPSLDRAAPPGEASGVYDAFVEALRARGIAVATGRFGATMSVRSRNEGPLSILLS